MESINSSAASGNGRHGAGYAAHLSPDAVAASMSRSDGGFGRDQETYFDHPALRKAHWRWEIVTYFFVGGIMSASGALSAVADTWAPNEHPALVRNGRYLALFGAAASGALLIKDLGRPERFLNMMRIFKLKSPMSVGVWSLLWFSMNAGLAVLDQAERDGLLPVNFGGFVPKVVRNGMLSLSSALMASYTGVLISATAIPVWYKGRAFIPAIFVCSAAATGAAANAALLAFSGKNEATIEKLERLDMLAALAEGMLLLAFEKNAGDAGKPLFGGAVGRRLRSNTLLGGIIAPLAIGLPSLLRKGTHAKRHVVRSVLVAGLTLVGGFVLRDSFIEAGRISADDPRPVLSHVG